MRGAKTPRSCPRSKLNNRRGRALPSVHYCLLNRVFENSLTTLWTSDADKGVHEKHSLFLARADALMNPLIFWDSKKPEFEILRAA